MNPPNWKRDEVDSPCINICVIHPDAAICIGCYRTSGEIARWSAISQDQRDSIRADLATRAPRLKKRRGGRAKRLDQPGPGNPT